MNNKKHSHYYKDVSKLKHLDVYRVLELFNVADPCLQHAIKKLLVAGERGAGKNINRDVAEAIDSLNRFMQMRAEDCNLPIWKEAELPGGAAVAQTIATLKAQTAQPLKKNEPSFRKLLGVRLCDWPKLLLIPPAPSAPITNGGEPIPEVYTNYIHRLSGLFNHRVFSETKVCNREAWNEFCLHVGSKVPAKDRSSFIQGATDISMTYYK